MERSSTSHGQRKKIRAIQRTKKSSHDNNDTSVQSSCHIPHDLIVEILSRLPLNSVLRSLFVSKLWPTTITDPYFISSFKTKPLPCTLLIFQKHRKLFVFSSPLHNHKHDPYPQKEYCEFTIPNNAYLKLYDSVHGLICLHGTQLMVWNPFMRCLMSLPKPECNENSGGYVLGYDPINAKYIALCILTGPKIGIFTLGADQESWRILSTGCINHSPTTFNCRCINGVIYYQAFICSSRKHGIISFDLRSEKLSLIKHPEVKCPSFLASYEGRLALVDQSTDSGVQLWVLEDAESHKWIRKHFTPHPHPYKKGELKGVTDDGEYIYIHTPTCSYMCRPGREPTIITPEKSLYESFSVAYFDPKEKSLREVKFGGIAGEDIKRLDEIGFDLSVGLMVLPNHVECLMSSL